MAFRVANFDALSKFNSSTSSEILEFYENSVIDKIQKESAGLKSRTFAPSSLRCERKQWFRIRGVQPDVLSNPDPILEFKASVGTARHVAIQSVLKQYLKDDWISVSDYLKDNPITYEYKLQENEDGLETRVEILDPPIRFACDGIIRWKDRLYLLEIKTADYSSWQDLTDPKDIHIDQVRCYATLLGLSGVIFMYEDRQYGGMKCYEVHFDESDFDMVKKTIQHIQFMAECNLAPDRLNRSDYMCSNCEYRQKCDQWG